MKPRLTILVSLLLTRGGSGFSVPPAFSHDELNDMNQRLLSLESQGVGMLKDFFEPHLSSFSVQPGASRLSITSTCYALQAMLSAQTSYETFLAFDTRIKQLDEKSDRTATAYDILQALLHSEWREEDMFQVPLLLYTILKMDPDRHVFSDLDEQTSARVRQLVSAVLRGRPRRRNGLEQQYSDYLIYQTVLCYSELNDQTDQPIDWSQEEEESKSEEADSADAGREIGVGGLPSTSLPDGSAAQVSLALARCAESSWMQVCKQLALRGAGDTTTFDAMRLAYSLLTYVMASNSLSSTAGRELVRGQGPAPGTMLQPANSRIVVAALAGFFQEQNQSGMWNKGQPIYSSFRRTGRNVGNAYIFAVDTVASLCHHLPAKLFRPHLNELRRTLEWIESNKVTEIQPDYCDPESGQCYGKALTGWASPHLSPGDGPQAWSTAQTLECVSRISKVVSDIMHNDVLNEFGGKSNASNGPNSADWNRLLDSDLGSCGTSSCRTLKDVLEERMVLPRTQDSSINAAYSAILFGPPGTAKSTICESLAKRIGWDFLVIDTSVFLADGLTNVASRIQYVFRRLQSLQNCLILFDEIEEFCLDRESAGMESRMLTTAMLTAINDLRRAQSSIFFLATNRLRALDAAITRPGRFDMQLFVGTPNREARLILLEQKLANVAVDREVKERAIQHYNEFLTGRWDDSAKFMNYLEGSQFAAACAQLVSQGIELTEDRLRALLDQQAAVMTVRGTVRDEYLASMDLSRL